MDDFSVFGSSFDDCLTNMTRVLKVQGEEFDSQLEKMPFHGKKGNCIKACNFTKWD